ncbi:type VI secretion system protein TssA [Pseudomonas sp. Teo4]|uniref:type VI secretion system protein TssA n=1 Tax=Pseudomonas sp. Teo4 TaxID=3064528 RepID=UPI002ABB5F05|nr:type VI secretion system protein TssA [Pseudomonas sp. Teo4]MDZ3992494.1 hypothetical protein [Pseudomonas sp. Teo4]
MSLVNNGPTPDIARLLAPIESELAAGLFDIEDETYQAIDQEMVKLGGLHESAIDWPYIEEASQQYLALQCKHLRIVGHLSVVWLRSRCWKRWSATLELLAGMVGRYWETAHPKPGPTGFLAKRKMVALLLKRLTDALPQLDRFSYSAACQASAQQAIADLLQGQPCSQIDLAALTALEREFLAQTEALVGAQTVSPAQASGSATSGNPVVETLTPPQARVALGNERETRRAVLCMAEFVNQQDVYDPTGYQLRRFGLWAHIQSMPIAGQEHRTELMAVPADIAGAYEEAIGSSGIDSSLLLRVEKSVAAAPYWIRGSFLAASMAARLAMDEVAEAIRCATARFVRRFPALQQLRFSDGTAFVDEQTLAWLSGAHAQSGQAASAQAFSGLHEELLEELSSAGIEPVLLRLQGLQSGCRSARERCHTTAIAADLLAARGVSWLAQDLCASVAQTMESTAAHVWEPEVYQKLKRYGAVAESVDQNKE